MKIESITVHPVIVKRQYGTVIAKEGGKAKNTVNRSHFFFFEVRTDNGLTGWGEVSDIPEEDLPKSDAEYVDTVRKFTVGRNPFDIQRMHHDFSQHFLVENSLWNYTRCAIDNAMYDLQGLACNRPVFDFFGGAVQRELRISWVAYIREDLNLIREEVQQKTRQGFDAFKLKVGVDIDLDEARLAAVRKITGPDASIKVDANEGWSVDEAPRYIRRLNKYDLAGVETPVPREDPRAIAAVRKQVDVPILEHVSSLDYGLALVKAGAVDAFNVATPGAGGLWPARQIVTLADSAGVGVLLGSTVELGPGTLAQLHFGATVPNLTLPNDLIGPGMYTADVLQKPLTYTNGRLHVPNRPGLGIAIDRAKLKQLAPKPVGAK